MTCDPPRPLLTSLATGLMAAFVLLAGAPAARAAAATGVVIEGKGWGHGVGMAQDGAYAMGRAGSDTSEILGQFYPGTALGEASGRVRVEVRGTAPGAVVAFPDGGRVLDARSGAQSPGFPVAVQPGGQVELSFDGSVYRARPLAGATLHPSADPPPPPPAPLAPGAPPTSAAPPPPPAREAQSGRPLFAVAPAGGTVAVPERDRRYRGLIEAVGHAGGLRLMNEVDVEDYLKGMGEVRDPGWPPAGLRAQAIAARTYALRAMALGGQLCDTQRCQVYLGQTAEYQAMNKAVADTARQVLTYGGSLALTVYSANGGGFSATPTEGWGGDGDGAHPYLRAAPYPATIPDPWTERTTLADLFRRFGGAGEPATARVSRTGPSGRVLEVTLEGSGGPVTVDGHRFTSTLRLRSNLFTIKVEEPPPPPPPPVAEPAAQAAVAGSPPPRPGTLPARFAQPAARANPAPWILLAVVVGGCVVLRRPSRRATAPRGLP